MEPFPLSSSKRVSFAIPVTPGNNLKRGHFRLVVAWQKYRYQMSLGALRAGVHHSPPPQMGRDRRAIFDLGSDWRSYRMGIFDRTSGKPDVRKLERLADVPALLEALNFGAVQDDATWRLRASAAAALGRLGRPETLGPVRAARQQAQAFAADLRLPDRDMLGQFQRAEADLLAAHAQSADMAGPARPAPSPRPAFNWVTPLFLNAFFAVVLFLWPTNSYGTHRLVPEILSSLCSAVFFPFGVVWLDRKSVV